MSPNRSQLAILCREEERLSEEHKQTNRQSVKPRLRSLSSDSTSSEDSISGESRLLSDSTINGSVVESGNDGVEEAASDAVMNSGDKVKDMNTPIQQQTKEASPTEDKKPNMEEPALGSEGGKGDLTPVSCEREESVLPTSHIIFKCESQCQCSWRALLHHKKIHPLENLNHDVQTIFSSLHRWIQHDLSAKLATWADHEIEEFHFIIESLTLALRNSSADRRKCQSWTRKITRRTAVLPSSCLVQGVERRGNDPVSCGGFADIYFGEHLGEPVAIKMLRFTLNKDQRFLKFRKEVALEVLSWRSLKHAHILPLLGVTYDIFPGRMCLISPWMPNGSILEYLRKRPDANKLLLLHQCAQGLYYIHNLDLVHRDVKGDNILIDADGNAQLSDFGLTSLSGTGDFGTTAEIDTEKGTVHFMAPELFQPDAKYSRSSDVYAYAMTLYQVYTGSLPFPRMNDAQVVLAVHKGRRPEKPASQYRMSDRLWSFINRCWAESPSVRPKIVEVEKEIAELLVLEPRILAKL